MAEAKKPAPPPAESEAPKPKRPIVLYIVIVLLILVILVGGAFATWLFITLSNGGYVNGGDPAATEEHASSTKEKKKKSKHSDEPPVFEKLDTYTVNLQGGMVLQTEIHVEVSDEHQKEVVKNYLPRISSDVNLLLSSKKPEDLATVEGKKKLKTEIKKAINEALGAKDDEDGVKSVEFKTFIVQ